MKKTKIIKIFLIVTIIVSASFTLFPQYSYYHGKNKVMKTYFDWKYVETPNFRVYHYTDDTELIKKIAVNAENAYDRMSKFLNVEVEKRIPLIFYKTHADFEQTNIFPGFLPLGVEAFAEPVTNRMVLHGDSSEAELTRTLVHELGHVFEYQIMFKKSSRSVLRVSRPPLWVMEGFSEYITNDWRPFSLLTIRDAALNDMIPRLHKSGQMILKNKDGRSPYDFGHLIYDFIEEKYGSRGIRNLLYSYRGRLIGRQRNIFKLFGTSEKEFNYELRKYVRDKFRKYITKEDPEDYSFVIGPNFPFAFSFSHKISPTGEMLATVTANFKDRKIDIILISMKDGKVIKNITPGFTSKYDGISVIFNPEDGSTFTWDNKGETIAFFARKEYTNYLILIDILSGKTKKMIKLENIMEPTSPDFTASGDSIYFAGVDGTKSFIYSLDLKSSKIDRISSGLLYIKALDISPDDNWIAFSASDGTHSHIYLGKREKPEMAIKLTAGKYNSITPSFSKDGNTLYFSSDELESYNIYSIDLKNNIKYRYTDIKTANFFPLEIPGEKNKIVISSYHKGTFMLFEKDISKPLDKNKIEFSFPETAKDYSKKDNIEFSKEVKEKYGKGSHKEEKFSLIDGKVFANRTFNKDLEEELNFNLANRKKYKPFKTMSIPNLPPVTAGFGSDGSIFGFTQLQLTDLMSDRIFSFLMASFYGFKSYNLSYVNLKRRLQFFSSLYYFSDSYFMGGSYVDPTSSALYNRNNYLTVRKRYGLTSGFYYPFNRFYRAELSFSLHHQDEWVDEIFYGTEIPFSQFFDGYAMPVKLSLVGETTRFASYGPNMGHTFKISVSKYFKLGSEFLDSYAFEIDLRKYFRLGPNTVFATRLTGFHSGGEYPILYWSGGNNTLRASEFRTLSGNNGIIFNAELRFPLINYLVTPIGILGPVRGVLFFDIGGVWFDKNAFGPDYPYRDQLGFDLLTDNGLELKDGLSSFGFALEVNLWGYPLHFDWVYRTNLKESKFYGVKFWVGFDF